MSSSFPDGEIHWEGYLYR